MSKRPQMTGFHVKKVAYHEAGHAVIGRVLMLACGSATIDPDYEEGEAGHTITADPYACLYEWQKRGKVRGFQDAVGTRGSWPTWPAPRLRRCCCAGRRPATAMTARRSR